MNRKERRAQEKRKAPGALRVYADAVRHHSDGRLNEAGDLCREVLLPDPRHADSMHLLGVIAHQMGTAILLSN